MRPTRSGVVALASVPLLVVVAWLFGQPELAVAAVTLMTTIAGCATFVALRWPRLEVERTVRPSQVSVGEVCRIQLDVTDVGSSRSPVVGLRDPIGTRGEVSVLLAPLDAGERRSVSYPMPTDRRGLHPVGPVRVELEDPFGLVRRRRHIGGVRSVVVAPRTYPLAQMPAAPGDEPVQGTRPLATNATVEEEFAALRPYAVGDDIRRIHWRTTARVGEPVVRQYEDRWHRRTTVLLDVDATRTDPAAFERAVIVAASVVRMAAEEAGIVRLLTTDGTDSELVSAADHLPQLMDRLAVVEPVRTASFAAGLRVLDRAPAARLVAVIGSLDDATWRGWQDLTRGDGVRVLVTTTRHDDPAAEPPTSPSAGRGTHVVCWDGSTSLSDVWAAAMATPARPTPQPRVTIG